MKRFLAMILILALVLSVPIAPAEASQEENVTVVGETCPCGCGKAASEIQWKPYNVNVEGAPADGHYYLSADYAQSKQHTIMAGDRVVIDLRGYPSPPPAIADCFWFTATWQCWIVSAAVVCAPRPPVPLTAVWSWLP